MNQEKKSDNVVTKEHLAKLEAGTMDLDDFTAEQQARIGQIIEGSAEPDEASGVSDEEEPAKEVQEVTPETVVVDAVVDGTPKDVVPGIKFKEKADEANTYKQKADSLSKRLEEARAELAAAKALSELKVEPKVKDVGQAWSDQHQLDMASRMEKLEAQVLQGNKGALERLEKISKELEDQKTFAEVDAFHSEFSELKLKRPFEQANAEYIAFARKLGATSEDMSNVDKFLKDANYRKEMEAKGVHKPKDFDKLDTILQVFHSRKANGYPTLRAAYLDKFLTQEELEKRLNGSYTKGVSDAVDRIAQNKHETTVMDPGGSNGTSSGMTEAQMEAWLVANPRPTTATQRAVMDQINSYLSKKNS